MTESTHILIASYLSGNISYEDQRALNTWLKEKEANKTEFERVKKLWDLSQKQKIKKNYDSSAAWNEFVELKDRNKDHRTSALYQFIRKLKKYLHTNASPYSNHEENP
jgi:ferric-dicitrate binding protein FerR (iron transport regulator)